MDKWLQCNERMKVYLTMRWRVLISMGNLRDDNGKLLGGNNTEVFNGGGDEERSIG